MLRHCAHVPAPAHARIETSASWPLKINDAYSNMCVCAVTFTLTHTLTHTHHGWVTGVHHNDEALCDGQGAAGTADRAAHAHEVQTSGDSVVAGVANGAVQVTCMCWSGPGYMHVLVRAWLHACVGRVGATCLSNRYASKKGKERQMCGVTPQR